MKQPSHFPKKITPVLRHVFFYLGCPLLMALFLFVMHTFYRYSKGFYTVYYHESTLNILNRLVFLYYGAYLALMFLVFVLIKRHGVLPPIRIRSLHTIKEILIFALFFEALLTALNILFLRNFGMEMNAAVIDNFTFDIFLYKEGWLALIGIIALYWGIRWGALKLLGAVTLPINKYFLIFGVAYIVMNLQVMNTLDSVKYLSTFKFYKHLSGLYSNDILHIPQLGDGDVAYFNSVGITLKDPVYNIPALEERKNLVVVFLESFNRAYMEVKIPSIGSLTPNLNKFKENAVYYSRFVSAAPVTIKGVASLLCGSFPDIKESTFSEASPLQNFTDGAQCLPDILNKEGYKSIFLSGETKPFYAHMDVFLTLHGYDVISYPDFKRNLPQSEQYHDWLGIADYELAGETIRRLDALSKENANFNLATFLLGTHIPWKKFKRCPDPVDDRLANAIYCVDHSFGILWDYIRSHPTLSKNTVIAVVSDHKLEHNAGKYAKYIVPLYDNTMVFMIYDPDTGEGKIDDTLSYHPDFAPTVLNVMNFGIEQIYAGHAIPGPRLQNPIFVSPNVSIEDDAVVQNDAPCYKSFNELINDHPFTLGRANACDRKKINLLMTRWLYDAKKNKHKP